ncbi:MAG: MFS transporter [Candidatus Parcubacteria bacterium]|nr:MFS transporter [Candidatus Parcubacteria bacterium]
MKLLTKGSNHKFGLLYLAIFIFAISDALFAYVQSTYLNQYFGLQLVGLIFFAAYFLTFIITNIYPNLIAKYSNFKMAIVSIFLRIICFIIFIIDASPLSVGIAFIIFIASLILTFINLDIFLEAFTKNATTGITRGTYFTIYNLGWLVSPFLAGEILYYFNFNPLFYLCLILNLILLVIIYIRFKNFGNHYAKKQFKIYDTLAHVLKNKDLRKIFTVSFLLQLFYAVEVVYGPIYLNQNIGFNWEQIGIIFTFMLIPFVIFEYPAGYLADKYWGEKEILFVGMILMAISSIIMGYFTSVNLVMWAIILFLGRTGASLVEIMRETYFFKKVDVENIDVINSFRSTIPLAYLIAPILAIVLTYYSQFNYLFVILGIILIIGLWPVLTLKDTK